MGSGNRSHRHGRKTTVEASLTLPMKELRRRLYRGAAGAFTWTRAGGTSSSIGFFVRGDCDALTVTLYYRWRDTDDVRILVSLTTTPTQFGGKRWWLLCPGIGRGVACNRRVGKLYLPPGAKYFGCRRCHDLTYRSCQAAHREERLFARFGRLRRALDHEKSRRG